MIDQPSLSSRFERAACGWLEPTPDQPGWSDWLGPQCAVFELARASACRLEADSLALLSDLENANHEKLAEIQIEATFTLDGLPNSVVPAPWRDQLANVMRGTLAAIRAGVDLADWEAGRHNPLPPDFAVHAHAAMRHFDDAWKLGSGELQREVPYVISEQTPRATLAMLRTLADLDSSDTLDTSSWLAVHRIVSYILQDERAEPLAEQVLPLLLINSNNRGEVHDFELQVVGEGQLGCYLDPVSTGLLLVKESMQKTIRVAWRVSRAALPKKFPLSGNAPPSLRLAPRLNRLTPGLTGESAGGLFACGMYAMADNTRLNRRASASFCLDLDRISEEDPVEATDLRVRGVAGVWKKLDAAANPGENRPPLTQVALESEQAKEFDKVAPGGIQVIGVSSFLEAFHALTGDERIEADLLTYCDAVAGDWETLRHPENVAEDEHRLDRFVEPRYAILVEGRPHETSETERPDADPAEVGLRMGRYAPVEGKGADGLANLLRDHRWICLIEDAGAGKTVFTLRVQQFFASSEARQALSQGRPWLVARWDKDWPRDVRGGLMEKLQERGLDENRAKAAVDYAWREGRICLVLDGLDQQTKVEVQHLEEQLGKLSRCRIIMTSRESAKHEHEPRLFEGRPWEFARVELFDEAEQDEYLQDLNQDHLRELMPDRRAVSELLRFPVVLRMIRRRLEDYARDLASNPDTTPPLEPFRHRGDLYWDVSQHLLKRAFKKKDRHVQLGDVELLRQVLAAIPFQMMLSETSARGYRVAAGEIRGFLRAVRQRCGAAVEDKEWDRAREMLADTHLTDRCLMEGCDDQHIGFRSKRMMEFFAGVHLAIYAGTDCQEHIRRHANDPNWYWPFRFAIEMRPKHVRATAGTLCRSLSSLFERPQHGRRPTELMYRAWHYFENDRFTPPELHGQILPGAKEVLERSRGGEHVAQEMVFCRCPPKPEDRTWFWMGSDTGHPVEAPRHKVELTPFHLQQTTVTFAQYRVFDPAHEKDTEASSTYFGWHRDPDKPDDCPVTYVSWYDACMFAKWLGPGFRLPTEAEWEFACRAGNDAEDDEFHFGGELTPAQANFDENVGHTSTMGCYPLNAWKLDQMHGNVWEWCNDWYDEDYYRELAARAETPNRDPPGPTAGSSRVSRGCSWRHDVKRCRSAYRFDPRPSNRSRVAGFRVWVSTAGLRPSRPRSD